MWKIFKRKVKTNPEQTSEHHQNQRNVIRESNYEDDWMLNIEPVLDGDVEAGEEVQKFIEENKGNQSATSDTVITKDPAVDGPLSSIISGAKKTNEANVAEIIEGSETHRKMAMIEKIRREGGEMPEELYTDLSKSSFGSEYKERANSMSTLYKPLTIEEQLELRRWQSAQAAESRKLTVPQPEDKGDIAEQIQKRKDLSEKMREKNTTAKEDDQVLEKK